MCKKYIIGGCKNFEARKAKLKKIALSPVIVIIYKNYRNIEVMASIRDNDKEKDFLEFATKFIRDSGILGSGVNTEEATSYVKEMWGEAQADKAARAGEKKKSGKKKKKKGKARITSKSTHAGPPPPGLTKFSPEEAENQKAMMKRLFKQVCDSCGKSTYDKLKKCPCGSVRYCDTKCQRKHWQKHKQECVTRVSVRSCVKIQAMVRGWLVRYRGKIGKQYAEEAKLIADMVGLRVENGDYGTMSEHIKNLANNPNRVAEIFGHCGTSEEIHHTLAEVLKKQMLDNNNHVSHGRSSDEGHKDYQMTDISASQGNKQMPETANEINVDDEVKNILDDVKLWVSNPGVSKFKTDSYRDGVRKILFSNAVIQVALQKSVANREGYSGDARDKFTDLIVQKIAVNEKYRRQGGATKLLLGLAKMFKYIHLQQCISDDGEKLANSLIKKHGWYKQRDWLGGDLNVFSPVKKREPGKDDSSSKGNEQSLPPAKRQRTTNEATLEALQQKRAPKPVEIGTLRLPPGVESACGILTNMFLCLDIRSLCNVKRSSFIQQCRKAFGSDDFERVREEALRIDFKGRQSINEMRLSHPARRLYLLIERYKMEFPRGTAWTADLRGVPTPIICACERGRMDDVELFVNLYPYHKYITNRDVNGYRDDMTLKDMVSQEGTCSHGYKRTPLMKAAQNEHFQLVKYLIEQCEADPNIATRQDGLNALHCAANKRNTELTELLLNHMKIDSINKTDRWGDTPLDNCYDYNDIDDPIRQEILALIRSKGGYANKYDEYGNEIESEIESEEESEESEEEDEATSSLDFFVPPVGGSSFLKNL